MDFLFRAGRKAISSGGKLCTYLTVDKESFCFYFDHCYANAILNTVQTNKLGCIPTDLPHQDLGEIREERAVENLNPSGPECHFFQDSL